MSTSEIPLINYLVRMVVPMRREFQCQLDVSRFTFERAYAQEILAEAMNSQNQSLQQMAIYVVNHFPLVAPLDQAMTIQRPPKPAPPAIHLNSLSKTHWPDAGETAPKRTDFANRAATPDEDAALLARLERYRGGLR